MPTIKVLTDAGTRDIAARDGDNLYALLVKEHIAVEGSCGGNGTCGKCRIKIVEGDCPTSHPSEEKKLSVQELLQGVRLACLYSVSGDMTVEPLLSGGKAQIMEYGGAYELNSDGEPGYGLAVDIGTTTVAAFLIDLEKGKTVAIRSGLNAQRPYGGDVIARCGHAMNHSGGLQELKNLIIRQIDELTQELCRQANVDKASIRRVALAGNPTMMHLAAGLSVAGIAVAPYLPEYTDGFEKTAGETGLSLEAKTPVLFLPVISGYVGADTVAAVIASGMDQSDELSLLIDIGTNGEIVLGNKERLLTCSAAAGPAFEGGKITCGIGGVEGAIDKIIAEDQGLRYTTIGDKPARGICGSGLIDAIAVLLRQQCISDTGVLSADDCDNPLFSCCFDENGDFILAREGHGATRDIRLTQKDVREVQLAKSAMAAGVEILVMRLGVSFDDIQRVYLAGGFGSYIDYDSACALGLLPPALRERIEGIGNAAGAGARMAVCSSAQRERAERVAGRMEYIELAETKEFSDSFMENMMFPED